MNRTASDNDQTIQHAITDEITGHTFPVTVKLYSCGIGITIEGYGNKTMQGDAEIVYLDYFDGRLQVVIHNDYDDEDPLQIDLGKAFRMDKEGQE